jgi:hypothetical protein
MRKPRVLYVLSHYPQISETYIFSEIEALKDDYDIHVIGLHAPSGECRSPIESWEITSDQHAIQQRIREFAPDVLHTHWLVMLDVVARLSQQTGVPFTVRTHSFDVTEQHRAVGPFSFTPPRWMAARLSTARAVNADNCLGILAFPYKRPILERLGVRADKVVDAWPVVNYDRFSDPSPNVRGVMNVGAALPKKQMDDFLRLGALVPDVPCRLYALSYETEKIVVQRDVLQSPVEIVSAVEPSEMAPEYKRHDWLVYTASFEMNSVGWPMAIAEARAAGLGVAVPNLRPDLREYAGPGAVLYDSIDEVVDHVRQPPADEIREAGYEHAKRSDIRRHIASLTGLWAAQTSAVRKAA